jgi:hypothetical protein
MLHCCSACLTFGSCTSLGSSWIRPVASVLVGVGRFAFCRQSLIFESWSAADETAAEALGAADEAADDALDARLDADAPTSGDEGTPVGVTELLLAELPQPARLASAARAAEAASRAGGRVMGSSWGDRLPGTYPLPGHFMSVYNPSDRPTISFMISVVPP